MLRYRFLFVGRRAKDPLLLSLDDYAARLHRYAPNEVIRLREGTQQAEAALIEAHLAPADFLVVLDERGKVIGTPDVVSSVTTWQSRAIRQVTFVIGGADGLLPTLRERAQAVWALGRITLPHRLAHVILMEQLYRAHTVLRGEKYHRAG